jgi:uncharacterized membrane protein YhaH (DUF805 family)
MKYHYWNFWTRYFDFSGRTRRRDFWLTKLIHLFVLYPIMYMIISYFSDHLLIITAVIINLVFLIPTLAMDIRRLHDIGNSGWFVLLLLIPVVGIIILIVLWCMDSEQGTNKYGPNPKELQAVEGAQVAD